MATDEGCIRLPAEHLLLVLRDRDSVDPRTEHLQTGAEDLSTFGVRRASRKEFARAEREMGAEQRKLVLEKLAHFRASHQIEIPFAALEKVFEKQNLFLVGEGSRESE